MRIADRVVAAGFRLHVKGAGRVAGILYAGRPVRSVPTRLRGLAWEADPLDWMDQQVLRTGAYEPEITERLIGLLDARDTFWDVGANAGVHALGVKRARPGVEVVAFEPSPAEFVRLNHNAMINGLNIRAFCVALAEHRRYAELSLVGVGNSGLNSLTPWEGVRYGQRLPCWCDTGDDIVASGSAPGPDVLKVDVEGAELLVFRGMAKTLTRVRSVVFECHEKRLPDARKVLAEAGLTRLERLPSTGGGAGDWLAQR